MKDVKQDSVILLLDNEYVTVRCLPDKGIVHHTVHQPSTFETFVELMTAALEGIKEYGLTKWISDDRKNGPMPPEFHEWAPRHWMPKALEAGWRYWAMVVPEDVAGAADLMEPFSLLFEKGVRIMVFTEPDDALEWLDTVDE